MRRSAVDYPWGIRSGNRFEMAISVKGGFGEPSWLTRGMAKVESDQNCEAEGRPECSSFARPQTLQPL